MIKRTTDKDISIPKLSQNLLNPTSTGLFSLVCSDFETMLSMGKNIEIPKPSKIPTPMFKNKAISTLYLK